MRKFLKKNKVVLLVAGSILILGIVILSISLGWKKNQNVSDTQSSLPGNPLSHNQISPMPNVPTAEKPTAWIQGDSATYTMQFPSTWTPSASTVVGASSSQQGERAIYMPSDIAGTTAFPRVEVEYVPTDPKIPTIEQRIAVLAPLKFTRSDIQFHTIPAVVLEGPFTFSKESNSQSIDKKLIFFNYKNNLYTITTAYYLDKNIAVNRQIIDTMLATFQLK